MLCAQVVQQVTTLKNEGNKLFAERDYSKAIEQYEQALKMLPDGSAERADLLCNKAACFYAVNKYVPGTAVTSIVSICAAVKRISMVIRAEGDCGARLNL